MKVVLGKKEYGVLPITIEQYELLKIMLKKLSKLDAADGKLRMKEITFLKITVII